MIQENINADEIVIQQQPVVPQNPLHTKNHPNEPLQDNDNQDKDPIEQPSPSQVT